MAAVLDGRIIPVILVAEASMGREETNRITICLRLKLSITGIGLANAMPIVN